MADIECELAKGLYLSNYKTDKPDCEGFLVSASDGDVYTYMSYTDEMNKYITLKEGDLREMSKKLFPDKDIDPEEIYERVIQILGIRTEELDGAKYERSDGTFMYNLREGEFIKTVPFLQKQDLSFENPKDLEKIKSYQGIEWPSFSADQTELANLMKAQGYPVEHRGRSGFESRNIYVIELPNVDEENARDVIEKINQDIANANEEIEKGKLSLLDKEFTQNCYDQYGIFSHVFIGGEPEKPQDYDHEKYGHIETVRISNTKDHRRNISHEYRVELYDKEKLEKNKEKNIELDTWYSHAFETISREYSINFKFTKGDGYHYIINGRTIQNVAHLDLDLSNPEDVERALIQDKLSWCHINATNEILAEKMKARGYVLEYSGRSDFASRNSYVIKTQDGILTPEISEKMQQDLEECKLEVKEDKLKAFDEYFDEQSTDKNKVYAVVETGYNYNLTRIKNDDKYEMVAQERIACTSDYRQGYDHTYRELLIHVERIKNDKRNFIIIEVPQDMIGMVVGKGGRNIKELEKKFGKKFKIVQSAKEKEEQKRQKHQEDLIKLQNAVVETVGDYVLIADEQDLQKAVTDYMEVNKQSLPFIPNADELKSIYDKLCMEKESKIAEQKRHEEELAAKHQNDLADLQNDIKASLGEEIVSFSDADVAQKMVDYMKENKENLPLQPNTKELEIIQKNLLNERDKQIIEQERQNKLATEAIFEEADRLIRNFGRENNYEMPSDEKIKSGIAEFLEYRSDNPSYVRVADKTEKEIILLLQKERLKEQMADKKFNETTTKVLEKFFNSDESGGHGECFFSSVGKARRASAYDYITDKVMRKLGLSDSENHPLPTIQEFRRSRYREKVIDFEESYSISGGYDEYNSQKTKTEQPAEVKEHTLDNLAALWGANLKTFKDK